MQTLKSVLIPIAALAFTIALACTDSPQDADGQTSRPASQPASRPTSQPESAPQRTMALKEGMQKVDDMDLEGSLESWAAGKDIDFGHVIKRTGVFLDIAAKVKWDDNKKRERDPADHDRIVKESVERAQALVESARASNEAQVKERSELLIRRCTECHNKYK